MSSFEEVYDCEVHYQYLFDGSQKKYFPIISNLRVKNSSLDLTEFSSYPVISFHNCQFDTTEIIADRIRDMNFQNCEVLNLKLSINEFNGTLGFAKSSISLKKFHALNSPQIIAIVECVVIGIKNPFLEGINLHALAIIDSSLDYLDLNPLLDRIKLKQLILTDITSAIPLKLSLPQSLEYLKLKNLELQKLPSLNSNLGLKILHLDHIQIASYHHELAQLSNLEDLRQLYLNQSSISYLPDFNLPSLETLSVSSEIKLDDKLMARLKLSGLRIQFLG